MAGLESIDHVILLMLESRSFDHLLGYLYPKSDTFDGLDGTECNRDSAGYAVSAYPITPQHENAYYYPLANPTEGFEATNQQLFSCTKAPASGKATNDGFVTSFASELTKPAHPLDPKLVGAQPSSIMGMYSPETLPVICGLAKGFAVCDRWFASVPTQTFPNRAFAVAGTSLGYIDNSARGAPAFNTPSVFGKLAEAGQTWKIYGYSNDFRDTVCPGPRGEVVSGFDKFQNDAASGRLAAFSYIEPEWAQYPGSNAPPSSTQANNQHNFQVENDQHPVSNMAVGEKLIYDVYTALRSNQALWEKSLLIITYDEHGGNYDHVPPETDATPPDNNIQAGFDFTRFGVRVPAVIVSPLIPAGTVFRAPAGSPPYDHTSIIATLRARFNLGPLGNRDAIAPHLGPVLTLSEPRRDDPLNGVRVPTAADPVLQAGSAPIGGAQCVPRGQGHRRSRAARPLQTDQKSGADGRRAVHRGRPICLHSGSAAGLGSCGQTTQQHMISPVSPRKGLTPRGRFRSGAAFCQPDTSRLSGTSGRCVHHRATLRRPLRLVNQSLLRPRRSVVFGCFG